ncbi:MAG: hypothetical protein ACOZF0_04100 [Thermodesulfobacteriota bacterium]
MGISKIGYQNGRLSNEQTLLGDERKQQLKEILAGYHPENISAEEQSRLWAELKAAGIPRNRETIQLLQKAGFDIAPLPAGQDRQGIPDIQSGQLVTPRILDLFRQRDSGNITEAEFQSRIEDLKQLLHTPTGTLLDRSA